jgi:hypothetical protein
MDLGVVALLSKVNVAEVKDTSSDLEERLLILVGDAANCHGILEKGRQREDEKRKKKERVCDRFAERE